MGKKISRSRSKNNKKKKKANKKAKNKKQLALKQKEEAEAEAKKLAEAEAKAKAKEKALKVISKLIKNKKNTSALTPSYVPVELSQVANETLIEFNDLKNNKLSIKLINFL